MPGFNFFPSVMEASFYRYGTGNIDFERIDTIKLLPYTTEKTRDIFELGFRLKLGGLNYIKEPIFNAPVPFYLNIVSYSNINTTDISINLTHSELFDEDRLSGGVEELKMTIAKFRNDLPSPIEYDYINNFIVIDVFCTEKKIINMSDFEKEVLRPNRFNVIFRTKIPFINTI